MISYKLNGSYRITNRIGVISFYALYIYIYISIYYIT